MAIYHLSVKNIGRSDGLSAVACAAYRAGEKLIDKTYGKEQDYTKKTGVDFKKIYAPENTKQELLNRESLWNAVEQSETKKNGDLKETARLAKEFEVAFPYEISKEQRELMLDDLCKRLVEKHSVIVDAVIHAPHTVGGSDERNYHAHIMFTTRTINERGEFGKKAREFNDNGRNLVIEYRAYWAELENRELERAGSSERVSHLSHKERGIDLEPTQHEGPQVTQLRRQGIFTEISLKNDAIKALNAEKIKNNQIIKGLDQEIRLSETTLNNLRDQDLIQKTEEQNKQKENEQNIKQTSRNYFREVFSAIAEARKLRADVHQFEKEYENDYSASVSTDRMSLNHKTYQAHQNMMNLVQRYEQHAHNHHFLNLRDRTIAYLDSKKQEKKDLGMIAFLTKPKELKNLNDSIERVTDLFNYFSDIAKDFKRNPFIKSIEAEFFQREQQIKREEDYKKSFQKDFEESQRRKEHLRKLLEEDEKRRFNENQLRYHKETEEYHAKKAQKQAKKVDESLEKPVDRSNDFEM